MDDLMTVKTSDFEANLVIAKSYLIDNGIDCIINTEYLTISTKDGKSARLQVRSGDYRKAVELLIKGGFTQREDYEYTPD
ncbi:MAG: hypothetical protein ACK5KT_11975 [Dysgonomonas sp.]